MNSPLAAYNTPAGILHRVQPITPAQPAQNQQTRLITYEDAAHLDNLLQKWEYALMQAAEAQARFRSEFNRIVIPVNKKY